VRDQSIIWRMDGNIPATVVPIGTTLDIVAVRDGYCEVLIPERFGGKGERCRIATSVLELLPPKGGAPANRPANDPGPERQKRVIPPSIKPTSNSNPSVQTSSGEPTAAFRGFGRIGFAQFAARQSFEAIFGDARGIAFGGGAQVQFRNGMFIQGSVERLRKTGERVFVMEDTVFPLGIEDTITITPLHLAAGYRMRVGRSIAPYGGGGISFVYLTQTSEFDLPDEKYSKHSRGVNAIGGVEFRIASSISMTGELRYDHFPNALGGGGVSQLFNERNSGGVRTQFKVILGR
jgi:opacity protein-like surface antigen